MHPEDEELSFWAWENDELRWHSGQHQGEMQRLEQDTLANLSKHTSEDKKQGHGHGWTEVHYYPWPGCGTSLTSGSPRRGHCTHSMSHRCNWSCPLTLHWPVSTMYGELNPNNRQYTLYWFPVLSKVTNHNPTELFVTHGYAKYKHFHQYLIRQSFNLCVHIPRRPRHMNVTENLWVSEGKLGCQSSPCTLLETGSLAVHPEQNRLAACKILGIPVSVLSLWDHRQMLPHPALLHSGGLNSGPHTCMESFTHWTW